MSEFKEKVEEFKQSFQDPGFTTTVENLMNPVENVEAETVDRSPVENEAAPAKKRSHKRTESYRNKIDQLTFERNVKEAQNRDLLAKLQYHEQLLAEKQQQLEQNEQHKNAYYENTLHTRGEAILNQLKTAKEEGDIEKEVVLSRELAQIEADKSTYNLYKSQQRSQPSYSESDYDEIQESPYYSEPVYSQPSYEEPENEALDDWLEKNQWADPQSHHFSPRLREEVNILSAELDDILRYNGNANIIGTPQYFKTLDNLMAEKYAVSSNQQQLEERQTSSGHYNVAPVARNGALMSDQYMSKNPNSTRRSTPLTQEEYNFARNLKIRMPDGSFRSGSSEALKRFAEAIKSDDGSNKIRIDH